MLASITSEDIRSVTEKGDSRKVSEIFTTDLKRKRSHREANQNQAESEAKANVSDQNFVPLKASDFPPLKQSAIHTEKQDYGIMTAMFQQVFARPYPIHTPDMKEN